MAEASPLLDVLFNLARQYSQQSPQPAPHPFDPTWSPVLRPKPAVWPPVAGVTSIEK